MPSSTNLDQKADAASPPVSPKNDGMHTSTNSTSSLVRGRPKTTYFHGGIGGAGNYRKVIQSASPNSANPHPRTEHRTSPITRGLSNLFGNSSSGGNPNPGHEKSPVPTEEDLARANVRQKVSPSRGFLGIGGLGNRRSQRQPSPASDMTTATNADSGYVSNYEAPTVHRGAAEALRMKILGEKPRGQNSNR
ncbi:MAG: hypothetical protein L6R37_000502 [Teloschistes peruensis]|nr:MAG: hypothetical protein L6R37_000502 [Teloschistes peruensis]